MAVVRFTTPLKTLSNVDLKRDSRVKFDKILPIVEETPPVCPGFSGPVVLDFGNVENSTDVTLGPFSLPIDPAKYPGANFGAITFRTTIVFSGLLAATGSAQIVDEAATVYWNSGPLVLGQTEIDTVIALDPVNKHDYILRTSNSAAFFPTVQLFNPRLWIQQVNTNKATYEVPILLSNTIDTFGNYFAFSFPAYGEITGFSAPPAIFQKGGFSRATNWHIRLVTDPFTDAPGKFALFNLSTGMMVTGSEIIIPVSALATYDVVIPDNAPNFTDGDLFVFEGVDSAYGGAAIFVDTEQTEFPRCEHAAELYIRASVTDCESVVNDVAYTHHASDFPAGTVFFFEGTLKRPPQPSPMELFDVTAGAVVAGSTLVFGVGLTRQRSGPITLVDTHQYRTNYGPAPFTIDAASFIVAVVP